MVGFIRDRLAEAGCNFAKYEDILNPSNTMAFWDFWGILPHRASRADLSHRRVLLTQLLNPFSLGVTQDNQAALQAIFLMFQHLDQAYDLALERWEAAQSRLEACERRHGRAPIWRVR